MRDAHIRYRRPCRWRRLAALGVFVALIAALAACRAPSEPVVVTPKPPTSEPTGTPGPPVPLEELAIELVRVADGFDQPLFVTGAGDGSGRLFVVEKTGRVWVVRDGAKSASPFLDLSRAVSTRSEQGLLGLAFSPRFADDGTFYVDYTRTDGATVVSRFTARGDAAVPASEQVVLTVAQPYANHNGGMIAFGPDGYLYVGLGDGGGAGDPEGNGQNLGTLLGALLRIDVTPKAADGGVVEYRVPPDNPFVNRQGARPEIWAWGLRNPWRFSFDRATGDLWIGDVGQNAWEEIDFQPASSAGGENYGWNHYEGTHPYPPSSAPREGDYTMPLVEYDRAAGKSVTGGYVYRGTKQGPLVGTYFFADFVDGRIWGLARTAEGVRTRLLLDTDYSIASFGEDDEGELYVVDFAGGAVYRLVAKAGR